MKLRQRVGDGKQAAVAISGKAASLHLQHLRSGRKLGVRSLRWRGVRWCASVPNGGIGRGEGTLEGTPATVTLFNVPSHKDNHHHKGQKNGTYRPRHLIDPTSCTRGLRCWQLKTQPGLVFKIPFRCICNKAGVKTHPLPDFMK